MVLFLVLSACIPRLYTTDTGATDIWVAPDNSWETNSPPSNLQATGYAEGLVPEDFRMLDQFGDEVSLWQFYGNVILLDFSTLWCSQCNYLARFTEETYLDYKDQGFVYLTVLAEDMEDNIPDQEELKTWAEYYEISAPILADDGYYSASVVGTGGYPTISLIGRDMVIIDASITPAEDSVLRSAIEDAL